MSWHEFQQDQRYPLDTVITDCERRIRDGGVQAADEKQRMVAWMRDNAPATIVWSPQSNLGWGASPFNPRNWHRLDGKPLLSEGESIPDLPGDDGDT